MNWSPSGVWANGDYRRFWAATGTSQLGNQISTLVMPLIAATVLDASAFEVGALAAAGKAPVIVVGLFAGAWLDRRKRKPVMIAADLIRASLLLSIPIAWALDLLSLTLLVVVSIGAGTLSVFFDVGYFSYLPSLVPRKDLIQANSGLEATYSASQVFGPAIGGGLVSLLSAPLALVVDAGTFLGSAAFLHTIGGEEPEPAPTERSDGIRQQIRQGIDHIREIAILKSLLYAEAVVSFFGFLFLSIYVLFMVRQLELSASQIGLVFAVGGVGSLIGSIIAAPVERRVGTGRSLIGSLALFSVSGLLVPAAVLVPKVDLPLLLGAEFFQWLAYLAFSINAISMRQRLTPQRLMGRVNASFLFLDRGVQPFGLLAGGALGSLIGLPLTLVFAEIGMFFAFTVLLASPVRTWSEDIYQPLTNDETFMR